MMGLPMANRLREAGFQVRAADLSEAAREAFAAAGGLAFRSLDEALEKTSVLITMLPNGIIVREALFGAKQAVDVLPRGALIIDMSSSAPSDTKLLGDDLADRGIALIDAPVSGGVKRAIDGTLSIMAGGAEIEIERARPVLDKLGSSIFPTGILGSGHAMKALNNYVSAAGLVAAIEALAVGERFGLKPETIVDVLNASTGRNNATDKKMKQFVLSRSFASGFSLALMAKDIRTAAELADQLGLPAIGIHDAAAMWEQAHTALGAGADHTEIFRYLLN
jgi:3-hydroxyisobutyrate dehydrogenase